MLYLDDGAVEFWIFDSLFLQFEKFTKRFFITGSRPRASKAAKLGTEKDAKLLVHRIFSADEIGRIKPRDW